MKHEDIWRALDTLAAEKGLSPSGLARAAGLDPTTFNRSKRVGSRGLRWPSTESLSRVLSATGATLESFTALVGGARALTAGRGHRVHHLPLLALSQLEADGLFDEHGHPSGRGWEETPVPQPGDPHSYAVRVDGPRLEPVFREGGTLIVSPAVPIRPGDRVLLRRSAIAGGNGLPGVFVARERTGTRFGFDTLDAAHAPLSIATEQLEWLHRIIWASS